MDKLAQWSVELKDGTLMISGWDAEGQQQTYPVSEVAGPNESRIALPHQTVAWLLEGAPIILVDDFAGYVA